MIVFISVFVPPLPYNNEKIKNSDTRVSFNFLKYIVAYQSTHHEEDESQNTSVFILKSENIEKTFLKDTRVLPAVFYSFNLSRALHLFISRFFIRILT